LDEWEFLPTDDADEPVELTPEEAALHVERPVEGIITQPWSEMVASDEDDGTVTRYFADEEPERPSSPLPVDGAEHEPDLEEILESQHYAFRPESAV
jgi:hypothetical protein